MPVTKQELWNLVRKRLISLSFDFLRLGTFLELGTGAQVPGSRDVPEFLEQDFLILL